MQIGNKQNKETFKISCIYFNSVIAKIRLQQGENILSSIENNYKCNIIHYLYY